MEQQESAVVYDEVDGQDVRGLRTRYCPLRFGAVAVAAQGIGGVATPPVFRQRGHGGRLVRRGHPGRPARQDPADLAYNTGGGTPHLPTPHAHRLDRY